MYAASFSDSPRSAAASGVISVLAEPSDEVRTAERNPDRDRRVQGGDVVPEDQLDQQWGPRKNQMNPRLILLTMGFSEMRMTARTVPSATPAIIEIDRQHDVSRAPRSISGDNR